MVYLKKAKTNLASLKTDRIAQLQGFIENNKPTLAGVMLFSDYPQAYFPQLCITAVSVPGNKMSMTGSVGERFVDNRRIEGTLVQMLDEALAFVRRNMKEKTIIDKDSGKRIDKTEYPVIAIREIILNALIHRDYSIHTDSAPITITMYSDRIEVENPGGLYGRMTLDQLGKVSADTGNPFIANAMEVMKQTENRYSGIPTIINSMKKYGLPEPLFENDRGVFRVTLYNAEVSGTNVSDMEMRILEFCKTPKSRKELEAHFKEDITIPYLMNKYVHPMIEKGKPGLTIPDAPKSKNQKYYTL